MELAGSTSQSRRRLNKTAHSREQLRRGAHRMRTKKLVAERDLEIEVMKEIAAKKW
jgi:hypothetical protein